MHRPNQARGTHPVWGASCCCWSAPLATRPAATEQPACPIELCCAAGIHFWRFVRKLVLLAGVVWVLATYRLPPIPQLLVQSEPALPVCPGALAVVQGWHHA